ncbi:unnamed protein product [Camellia sinensis]
MVWVKKVQLRFDHVEIIFMMGLLVVGNCFTLFFYSRFFFLQGGMFFIACINDWDVFQFGRAVKIFSQITLLDLH